MSNRLDQEKEAELQPQRMEFATQQLCEAGFNLVIEDGTKIKFLFKNKWVTFYPYSGWHTGKTIKDGRGLQNLLKQLR